MESIEIDNMAKGNGQSGQQKGREVEDWDRSTAPTEIDLFRYVGHMSRQVAHALPMRSFGYVSAKRDWVKRFFEYYAFSFIIQGQGTYREDGREWRFAGPCVLLQRPGHSYDYGPDDTWEEFFVTYDADCRACFTGNDWEALKVPVISLKRVNLLRNYGERLLGWCGDLGRAGALDRLDQLFEELLLEVLLVSRSPRARSQHERLQAAREWLEEHSSESIDFDSLAKRQGMSGRTLRRRWREHFGVTPVGYLLEWRLQQACRLLAHGNQSITAIAAQVGFSDAYYFSRRFRSRFNISPTEFQGHPE